MARPRNNFTNRQRAEIFVRDRALCSFSGRSLWHLDYGAGSAMMDCVDHIVPSASGGLADLDNGGCATVWHNKLKSKCNEQFYLFHAGSPTADFYCIYEIVPDYVVQHLKRFASLHYSDWYFNKAVIQVLSACNWDMSKRVDGSPYLRGQLYWCSAAMKTLEQWARILDRESPRCLRDRGLLPEEPSSDQELLLALLENPRLDDLMRISAELMPYCESSAAVWEKLSSVRTKAQAARLLGAIEAHESIVPRVKSAVRHNLQALFLGGRHDDGTKKTSAASQRIGLESRAAKRRKA